MRSLFLAGCLMAAAWLAAPTVSAEQGAPGALDPSVLIEKSGLDTVFEQLDQEFRATGETDDLGLDPELKAAWVATAAEMRLAERLPAAMAEGLGRLLDDSEVVELAAFYDSPLGQRIIAAEREALAPEATALIETEGAATLAILKQQPERWAEHRAVIENSGSAEIGVEIYASMMVALFSGLAASRGAYDQLSREEIDGVIAAQVGELLPELQAEIERSVAYTYRDIATEDLATYNEFLSSRAGRKFFAVTVDVFGRTLSDEMYVFGRKVSAAVKNKDI